MSQHPQTDFQRTIHDARGRHNLSDVVLRHTALKRRGARELVGLCPFHQERTPSFEVNDTKGTYYCHGCGEGGDAITFLIRREGMRFIDAVRWLSGDNLPLIGEEERTKRKAAIEREMLDRIEYAQSLWGAGIDPKDTPAEVYARSRGITGDLPETVRFAAIPRWRNAETGECGRDVPAMVCALQDWLGRLVGVQCVFLDDGGRKKYQRQRPDGTIAKAKLSFGQVVGSAFRIGDLTDTIVVCEGPEDALTLAQQLPSRSVWASCGTAMMSRMRFRSDVSHVVLAGDNGKAGIAAVKEAEGAFIDLGLRVSTIFPDPQFKDWNDELMGVRA